MSDLIPVTDELLKRARQDSGFRYQLLSEHLDELTVALSRARNRMSAEFRTDPQTAREIHEGTRLAIRLTEILHHLSTPPTRK
jgi:hypothetical protein